MRDVVERRRSSVIIHSRLSSLVKTFSSLSRFQCVYRKFHSTETALLRIHNDLIQSINTQKVFVLLEVKSCSRIICCF